MEDQVEIPSYFLCPISLQLMRDPVTLPTGITFDRESIERWLFSTSASARSTCPVTNQPLPHVDLTPNHTLRRLIQSWCVANASSGIERLPTPRPPVDRAHISDLLHEARCSPPGLILASILKLKEIVSTSEANRRCVVNHSEAVEFLAFVIEDQGEMRACDEALTILQFLGISEQRIISLMRSNVGFLDSLFKILQLSNYNARANATLLLKSIVPMASPSRLSSMNQENLHEIVSVLKDRISCQATKAALQVLIDLLSCGGNRIKAVNAGAVYVLIDLLLEEKDKRTCELALAALSKLCGCSEGRAELLEHAAGMAVVSKKILRVSTAASDRAVRIVEKLSKLSASPTVLQEMLQVGVVSKLCLLMQVDCGVKLKERVKEILRLHARTWRRSPCLSPQFLISYPAS